MRSHKRAEQARFFPYATRRSKDTELRYNAPGEVLPGRAKGRETPTYQTKIRLHSGLIGRVFSHQEDGL